MNGPGIGRDSLDPGSGGVNAPGDQGHDQASKQQSAHGDLRHSARGRMQNLFVVGFTGLSLRLGEHQSFTDRAIK